MLGENEKIDWCGEFSHFCDWENPRNLCSCGRALGECDFWTARQIAEVLGPAAKITREYEKHRQVPSALLNPSHFSDDYKQQQSSAIRALSSGNRWLLDSSKYVGRALGLARCDGLEVKYIYLVRDPRGVVFSFAKKVQTRRSSLRACLYYISTNIAAQLAVLTRLKRHCLKIRYEDLVSDPERVLARIGRFLDLDLTVISQKVATGGGFGAEHVAGGNRWAKLGSARLRPDVEWREDMGWTKRLIVYLACLPLQIINRYGI